MLDPAAGRARIMQDADRLVVLIKGKRSPLIAAFLGFWLCGWAFGWVMVTSILLFGDAGAANVFLLVWLGAWTVGGVLALAQFLSLTVGRETIEISTQQVVIKRHLPIWTKKVVCHFADIKRLRAEPNDTGKRSNAIPNWYSQKSGNIQLDYGVHSLGFGIDLDAAETSQVVTTVTAVFPELGAAPNA